MSVFARLVVVVLILTVGVAIVNGIDDRQQETRMHSQKTRRVGGGGSEHFSVNSAISAVSDLACSSTLVLGGGGGQTDLVIIGIVS